MIRRSISPDNHPPQPLHHAGQTGLCRVTAKIVSIGLFASALLAVAPGARAQMGQTPIPPFGTTHGTVADGGALAQTEATQAAQAQSSTAAIASEAATARAAEAAAQKTANAALPSTTLGHPNGPAALDSSGTLSANTVAPMSALNARTQAAMAADRINVLSQAVVADGATDNSLTLPAACAVAAAAGKALYLPAGIYIVDGADLSACPMIIGDGPTRTVIRRKPNAVHGFVVQMQNVSGFSARDFAVDGNAAANTVPASGLLLTGDWNFDLQNVAAFNNLSDGVYNVGNQDAAHSTSSSFFRVSGYANRGVGIHLRQAFDIDLLQSSGTMNTSQGLMVDYGSPSPPLSWVEQNKNIVIDEFTADGNGKSGIYFPGFMGPQTTPSTMVLGNGDCTSDSVVIHGAHAENNAGYGLVVQGCGFSVTGGVFRANGVKVNGFFGGFYAGVLANADNLLFTGNVLDGNEYYGMDAGGCYDCKITANLFKNNGKQSSFSGGVGVNVGASRYTDVDGNTFAGNGFVPGGIAQLTITPGSGYAAPTITASGGSGSGASLVATEAAGSVTGVRIVSGGTSWLDPIVTSTGGGCTVQPTYSPTVTQAVITYVAVLTPGSGCTAAPTVTATDGTGFAATLTVTAGRITGYTITNPGQGYANPPVMTISDATGTGATAVATIGAGNSLIAHRLDGTGGTNAAGIPVAFGWDASHLRIRGNKFIVDSASDYCVHVLEDIQYLDVEDNHCSNPLEVSGSLWQNAFWLESTLATVRNNTTDQVYPFDQHYHQSGGDVMVVPDYYEHLILVSAAPSILTIETNFIATYINSVYAVKMVNQGASPYALPVASASGGGCTTEPVLQVYQTGDGYIANIGVVSPGAGCTSAPTVTITDSNGAGAGAAATAFIAPWGALTGRKLDVLSNATGLTFVSTGTKLKLNGAFSPSVGDILSLEGLNAGVLNEVSRSQPAIASSTPGAPTACGTSPSVASGSSDLRGTITMGSGSVTACTLPFGVPHPTAPICTASTNNASVSVAVDSVSTTGMTLGFSASLGGGQVAYVCEP